MTKIIIAIYVLITSSALIVLKLSSTKGHALKLFDKSLPLNLNVYTVLGVFLYGISFVLYYYLISKYDLGFIIPLATAFIYILIFIASFLIFKEVFTTLKIVGIALILCGIIFLSLNR